MYHQYYGISTRNIGIQYHNDEWSTSSSIICIERISSYHLLNQHISISFFNSRIKPRNISPCIIVIWMIVCPENEGLCTRVSWRVLLMSTITDLTMSVIAQQPGNFSPRQSMLGLRFEIFPERSDNHSHFQ